MTEIENNPHQALIEKSVDEFCDFDFYTDGGNIGAKEVEPWLRKTLQATIDTVSMIVREEEAVEYNKIIDTVLEKQRRELLPFMQHDLQCAIEFEAGDCDCGLKDL